MKRAFTPGLKVASSTLVQRRRELPVSGEITHKKGDKVMAHEVLGRALLPGDLHIVRLAERMGLHVDEVMSGLRVSLGDQVQKGQLLCEHRGLFGLFKSRYFSPHTGVVELVTERTGHIGIRAAPRPIEIGAYITGNIVELQPGKSAVIEAHAALVQGIFGVGGERSGKLHLLEAGAAGRVTREMIPADCTGLVLVGGHSPDSEVLHLAASRGANAFVTGSIDDRALAAYLGFDLGIAMTGDEEIPMTLIVTEGFGSMAMSDRCFAVLRELNGRQAAVNGATQVRAGAVRPEIIVTHDSPAPAGLKDNEVSEHFGLSVGSTVRVIRFPYFGLLGRVTELPHDMQQIETGAFARVLRTELVDGRTVTVPRANVELVG